MQTGQSIKSTKQNEPNKSSCETLISSCLSKTIELIEVLSENLKPSRYNEYTDDNLTGMARASSVYLRNGSSDFLTTSKRLILESFSLEIFDDTQRFADRLNQISEKFEQVATILNNGVEYPRYKANNLTSITCTGRPFVE